jgi:hypothetical protein
MKWINHRMRRNWDKLRIWVEGGVEAFNLELRS